MAKRTAPAETKSGPLPRHGPKKQVDIFPRAPCFRPMANPPAPKLVTPATLAVDAVLVAAFFFFMFGVLKSHVQSEDPTNIRIFAGLSSACMSGVFWLTIQMFRVVYRFQKELNAKS